MMDWFVKHLVWYWTIWFFVLLPVTFVIAEAIAIWKGGLTLSMYTWHLSEEWPLLIFVLGLLVGGLAVHFWWHWAPPSIEQLGGTGG